MAVGHFCGARDWHGLFAVAHGHGFLQNFLQSQVAFSAVAHGSLSECARFRNALAFVMSRSLSAPNRSPTLEMGCLKAPQNGGWAQVRAFRGRTRSHMASLRSHVTVLLANSRNARRFGAGHRVGMQNAPAGASLTKNRSLSSNGVPQGTPIFKSGGWPNIGTDKKSQIWPPPSSWSLSSL
jgi:hypothetical protein